jgi:hypothetical protein
VSIIHPHILNTAYLIDKASYALYHIKEGRGYPYIHVMSAPSRLLNRLLFIAPTYLPVNQVDNGHAKGAT